jgi:hemoglobin
MARKDITDRNDIIRLVDCFYAKVRVDALLAPKFIHLDWHDHVPIMYNFWSTMLLGEGSYQGNPFQKHIQLGLSISHFDKWLEIFQETVDELFEGAKATEAKDRTRAIAGIFQHKLGLFEATKGKP